MVDILQIVMSFIPQAGGIGRLLQTCKTAQAAFDALLNAQPYFYLALAGGERLCGLPFPVKRALAILVGRKCELCELLAWDT